MEIMRNQGWGAMRHVIEGGPPLAVRAVISDTGIMMLAT